MGKRYEFSFLKALKSKSNDNPSAEANKSSEAIARRWDMIFAKFSGKKR